MTVAKMSVYKRMKLACCFDCGRSERDCSCMSGSVHSNLDTLQRAYPLSSVSIHDCATTLRACKLHRPHMLLHVRAVRVQCVRAVVVLTVCRLHNALLLWLCVTFICSHQTRATGLFHWRNIPAVYGAN